MMLRLCRKWFGSLKVGCCVSALLAFSGHFYAQQAPVLNIDSCYLSARQQYPMIRQRDLINKSRDYTLANASKGYLPQLNISGQATYQSAVTEINIKLPGFSFPEFSKDQYKVYAELDQTIYDGGAIRYQKESAEANADILQKNLEVDLYALRDRVNQVFFGILLLDEQLKQNDLLQKDIQSSIDKMRPSYLNGTATIGNLDELLAELLVQQQNRIQLTASRKTFLSMMSQFINKPLPENTVLQMPGTKAVSEIIKRPELSVYDSHKKNYDVQDKILNAANRPRLSFFVQGGYGRPALNLFDNNFDTYYIGGLRFSWSLGTLYTLKDQRQILVVNRQTEDIQKETFLFNTHLNLTQQEQDMQKLKEMIAKDQEIIAKRMSVTSGDKARMENGSITISEFIIQLDKEDQARQSLLLHQVQMLLAQYNYQTISGN